MDTGGYDVGVFDGVCGCRPLLLLQGEFQGYLWHSFVCSNQLKLAEEQIKQRSQAAEGRWSCDKWQQSSAGEIPKMPFVNLCVQSETQLIFSYFAAFRCCDWASFSSAGCSGPALLRESR